MIFQKFVLGDLITNCYVIADEETKNAVLFDAADNAEKILTFIKKKGLTLKKIILTHAHFDHILALEDLKKATNAEICVHTEEEKYLSDPKLNLAGEHWSKLNIPRADCLFNDSDEIVVDSLKIKVIHTPGHTPGSSCFLVDKVLMSGDTLFSGAIGRFDFPLGSYEDEIRSIKEKLMILEDDVKLCPGHGFASTIGKQRKDNMYLEE